MDRNRAKIVRFVVLFVSGSALLLTAALVGVPGVLIGWALTSGASAGLRVSGDGTIHTQTVMSAAHRPCRLQCSMARMTVPGSTLTTTDTTGTVATGERSKRAMGASPA